MAGPAWATCPREKGVDMSRADFMGLGFDTETLASAVARCLAWCSGPRASHTVMTINASHMCMMRNDATLDRACRAGDLILADGMSVVKAAQLAGVSIAQRVAGVDLMQALLAAAGERGLGVYLLGAKPEVVATLARELPRRHGGLRIAGFRDGYFGKELHESVAREVALARPDILFIGMPSPFKETWGETYRRTLDVPVIMGVGGSFDVLAGVVRRAPVWMQNSGLEWFWRLLMEPRKLFMRYLTTNSQFILLAVREVCRKRFAGLGIQGQGQ